MPGALPQHGQPFLLWRKVIQGDAVKDQADRFLLGGAKSASFSAIGDSVMGVIVEKDYVQEKDFTTGEPAVWKNSGEPKMQVIATLRTLEKDPDDPGDDGERRVYIRGNLKKAVALAVRASGANSFDVGGILQVKYVADGVPPAKGFSAPKEFKAVYTAPDPATAALLEPDDDSGASTVSQTASAAAASEPEDLTPEAAAALRALMGGGKV